MFRIDYPIYGSFTGFYTNPEGRKSDLSKSTGLPAETTRRWSA